MTDVDPVSKYVMGEVLAEAKRRRRTQRWLAEKLDVHEVTVSRWASGALELRLWHLRALGEALEVNPGALLERGYDRWREDGGIATRVPSRADMMQVPARQPHAPTPRRARGSGRTTSDHT